MSRIGSIFSICSTVARLPASTCKKEVPRRAFLTTIAATMGLTSLAGCKENATTTAAPKIPPIDTLNDPENLTTKEKLLKLIQASIDDYSTYDAENKKITITKGEEFAWATLVNARDHFSQLDESTCIKKNLSDNSNLPKNVIPAQTNFSIDTQTEGDNITANINGITIMIQEDVINDYWEYRGNKIARDSFASLVIKEGYYLQAYKKDKDFLDTTYTLENQFVTTVNQFAEKLNLDDLEIAINRQFLLNEISKDPKTLALADKYFAHYLRIEYVGYATQLEFLHRQGYQAKSPETLIEELAKDTPGHVRQSVIGRIKSDNSRLKFVADDGTMKEDEFKIQLIRELSRLTKTYRPDHPLRISMEIMTFGILNQTPISPPEPQKQN